MERKGKCWRGKGGVLESKRKSVGEEKECWRGKEGLLERKGKGVLKAKGTTVGEEREKCRRGKREAFRNRTKRKALRKQRGGRGCGQTPHEEREKEKKIGTCWYFLISQ